MGSSPILCEGADLIDPQALISTTPEDNGFLITIPYFLENHFGVNLGIISALGIISGLYSILHNVYWKHR